MTLRWSADGDLLFNAYRASAKVQNIERDPRVSCVVAPPGDEQWVVVNGRAELLGAAEGAQAWHDSSGGPAVGDVPASVPSTVEDRLADGRRVVVRVRPEVYSGIRRL